MSILLTSKEVDILLVCKFIAISGALKCLYSSQLLMDQTSDIIAEVFLGFPQSMQANDSLVP
jgi:hypothetical protein